MTNQPLFPSAAQKIQRAVRHGQEVERRWKEFLETDFCEIAVETDLESGSQSLGIRNIKKLPGEIPLAIGDSIHCLRCALDHVINAILGGSNTRISFPMDETRDQLIESFRTTPRMVGNRTVKKGRNASIEEALPGIGEFITNELKPYRGADGLLWALGRLDNTDKHRLVTPVIVPREITVFHAVTSDGCTISDLTPNFHPVAIRASALFSPTWAGEARGCVA
jgi:hypothetical protein